MGQIDQDLYNRQIYVLGSQAMAEITKSNVLLCGLGPLGSEIAKNIILAGIGTLTILDDQICDAYDLGTHFLVNENVLSEKAARGPACLMQLQALNPYVKINHISKSLASIEDLDEFLRKFNTVILTEAKGLNFAIKVNEICRTNGIKFLLSDVYGLLAWSFTDFGDDFEVTDVDGEEYREEYIGSIQICDAFVHIKTLDKRFHNLETGDLVKLEQLAGLSELNNKIFSISVVNANEFKFQAKLKENQPYASSGLFRKMKKVEMKQFKSLRDQLIQPDLTLTDLSEKKYFNPYLVHVCLAALGTYLDLNLSEYNQLLSITEQNLNQFNESNNKLLANVTINDLKPFCTLLYFSYKAKFPPLCASLGGLVAQEALKSITKKFVPIKQWIHLEYSELSELDLTSSFEGLEKIYSTLESNDRYYSLRLCFGGNETLSKLANSKLFMVGCGAIGCEMLKNYALLGVATDEKSLLTITDNDLIEKSNLNRQFLFRPKDIQKAKSVTAANAVKTINAQMKIVALEKKVSSQTELEHFNDEFFSNQDLCVNALDNLEARRYMDTRCVANQKPLLESGTLGTKGHIQVIIPHLTESYNSQKDPNDENAQIPYCTLKSFPSNIEHCIQWARDKFESCFKIKSQLVEKFLSDNQNLDTLIERLNSDENLVIENVNKASKLLNGFCLTWTDCLLYARIKFEKYFSNKAKNLLHAYPLDHLMNDGSLFWKLPKRPPTALKFDSNNQLHLDFVLSFSKLIANVNGIKKSETDEQIDLKKYLSENESKIPEWKPVKKHIETDESKQKEQIESQENSKVLSNSQCAKMIEEFCSKTKGHKLIINSLNFEKDDDTNGHVDFILACANLRASMYSIEHTDKLQAKKIAGKIVPAIATTTSCVAGFVSIELVKIIQNNWKLDKFRNSFLNLAIPMFIQSEPGVCTKTKIAENCYVTLWDKWSIRGNENYTLKNFIDSIKKSYNLTVSGVMHGSKSIYLPVMPTHAKRLNEKMVKLIKGVNQLSEKLKSEYVDLYLTYSECDNNENRDQNNLCPPIRYFFS